MEITGRFQSRKPVSRGSWLTLSLNYFQNGNSCPLKMLSNAIEMFLAMSFFNKPVASGSVYTFQYSLIFQSGNNTFNGTGGNSQFLGYFLCTDFLIFQNQCNDRVFDLVISNVTSFVVSCTVYDTAFCFISDTISDIISDTFPTFRLWHLTILWWFLHYILIIAQEHCVYQEEILRRTSVRRQFRRKHSGSIFGFRIS